MCTLTVVELIETSLMWISAFIIACLFGIHTYKVYHDLHTEQRRSLAHVESKPEITTSYRLEAYSVLVNLLCYFWTATLFPTIYFVMEYHEIMMIWLMVLIALCGAKTAQYSAFSLRLHHLSKGTIISYPRWLLMSLVVIGFLGSASLSVIWAIHYVSAQLSPVELTADSVKYAGAYGKFHFKMNDLLRDWEGIISMFF